MLTLSRTAFAVEKWTFIQTADAVVAGELKLSSYFLSVDGLHVNGTIVTSEVLYGNADAGQGFEYHLVVPCSVWDAIQRGWHHWSETKELFTRKQIWALVKGEGSSWTAADPRLVLIYDLNDRKRVISVLAERPRSERGSPKP